MRKKILDLIDIYCNSEIADFSGHQLYTRLQDMVNALGYHLECEYGRGVTRDTFSNVYLSISVYDQYNETVEIYDEGCLSASTELVMIDKKERIRFLTWEDEDFIDSIHWMTRLLQKLKCDNDQ